MYAVTVTEPGGPEVLEWSKVPDPRPGPGEVLIQVHASGVNRADLLQRSGRYPPPPGAPPYPGLECSGVVVEVGPEVTGVAAGDPVCALLAGGGYAERVAVPAGQVLPVPRGVDLVDAAALPEVACTVWSNLVEFARLTEGETLLVHGGGSGIGTFAIQFATALGARVVTTARAVKHPALRALGAAVTIDYTTEDFVAATKEATGGRGADVILIIGAACLASNCRARRTAGWRSSVAGWPPRHRSAWVRCWPAGVIAPPVAQPFQRDRPDRAVRAQWPLVGLGRSARGGPAAADDEAAEAHRLMGQRARGQDPPAPTIR